MTVHALAEPAAEPDPNVEELRQMLAGLEKQFALEEPPQEVSYTKPERVVVKRAMPDREILAAMAGLGAVLTVRIMLAAAMVGAFALFYQAVQSSEIMPLLVAATYAVLICGPLVWLSTKRT